MEKGKGKPQVHIPANERQLRGVRLGELVKITVNARQMWTRFLGSSDGWDFFTAQEKAKHKGDKDLVAVYTSLRRSHGYDKNLGIILSLIDYDLRFVGPRRGKEYSQRVKELKEVGLWKE